MKDGKVGGDADLVRAALAGDRRTYGLLVERYSKTVYGLAYAEIGDFDRARDAAQEVFVRAYLRLSELREPERFAPWLRRMTVNECRARRRDDARVILGVPDAFPEQQGLNIADPAMAVEARLTLQQALGCLTEDSRRAILLFYFHGHSLAEIAAFLDASVPAVKSRLRGRDSERSYSR